MDNNLLDLSREFYELRGRFDSLSQQVTKLQSTVDQLNDTLSRGRGAYTVLIATPAFVGMVAAIASTLGFKFVAGD